MFIGRNSERKTLEDIYTSDRSGIVVLYGRIGMGKTALVNDFIKDKEAVYYQLRDCTMREQLFLMEEEFSKYEGAVQASEDASILELLDPVILASKAEKKLVIFDEFHLGTKEPGLAEAIAAILAQKERYGNVMFILCSSSVNWVENEMVNELGTAARFILKFMKLKEMGFMELSQWFPRLSVEECIAINAVIGGVPAYLSLWDDKKTSAANIKRLFLSESAPLFHEAENVLRTELRELSAYNTILYALASGKYKLNEIYLRTGFSRAKISVYIKNLIKLDVVEKVFSADSGNNDNAQKGLYRINDNFLNFWYRFVFPNISAISSEDPDKLFDTKIKDAFKKYQRDSFRGLCLEYLKLMARHKRLGAEYDQWGSWYGKNGIIDILAANGDKTLTAICNWGDRRPDIPMLDEINATIASAGIKPVEIYLFSQKGISAEARMAYQKQPQIKVVELKDL